MRRESESRRLQHRLLGQAPGRGFAAARPALHAAPGVRQHALPSRAPDQHRAVHRELVRFPPSLSGYIACAPLQVGADAVLLCDSTQARSGAGQGVGVSCGAMRTSRSDRSLLPASCPRALCVSLSARNDKMMLNGLL
eukprot:365991-Rhodomonas_salina.2